MGSNCPNNIKILAMIMVLHPMQKVLGSHNIMLISPSLPFLLPSLCTAKNQGSKQPSDGYLSFTKQ